MSMHSLRTTSIIGTLLAILFVAPFLTSLPAHAQEQACIVNTSVTPSTVTASPDCKTRAEHAFFIKDGDCACCGQCTLDNFVQLAVNVARFIFGIAGSLALLMVVIGGTYWLTAAGNSDRITKGRDTLVHAALGLAIIFGAWMIVNTILAAATGKLDSGVVELLGGKWSEALTVGK